MKDNANEVVEGQPRMEVQINDKPWGDHYNPKNDGIKIGFNNVGRLWISKKNNIDKNEALIQWLTKYNFDVLGISEVGINWNKIDHSRTLKSIARNKKISKTLIITAHNEHENFSKSQWGGVGLIIKGQLVKNCYNIRKDPKN